MNDDLTGQRLGTALRDHVPSTPQAPFDLTDVKGRARGMRRRRTLAGTAAGALATVVAATTVGPTAITALQDEDETVLPPAAQSLQPTPRGDVELTGDEPRGDDAAGWSDAEHLRDALGSEGPDAVWQMPRVARLGDTWLVEHRQKGRTVVTRHDDMVDATFFSAGEVAVDTTGTQYAYVETGSNAVKVASTASDDEGRWDEVTLAELPQEADVVDVSGDGCFDSGECRVVVSYNDGRAPAVIEDDAVIPVDPDVTGVTAVHGDVMALLGPPGLDGNGELEEAPCTRVVDGGEELWSSCELAVEAFSPDGRWALVRDAYQSGWGLPRVGIADAGTGELYFWIDPPGESAGVHDGGAVWEGDGHVVLSTWSWSDQEWNLFRVSLTGEVEQAADSRGGTEGDFPFFPPID